MTQRFPSLCHWGAFTAVVEQGRFVHAEPFALDPSPSALLDALPEVVYSKLRVARRLLDRWQSTRPCAMKFRRSSLKTI